MVTVSASSRSSSGGQDRNTPRRSVGDPGLDGSHQARSRGVSSALRRCMSSAAVVDAATADLAADRSDRRAYQTAPTALRAATIATTRAAMSMAVNRSDRRRRPEAPAPPDNGQAPIAPVAPVLINGSALPTQG